MFDKYKNFFTVDEDDVLFSERKEGRVPRGKGSSGGAYTDHVTEHGEEHEVIRAPCPQCGTAAPHAYVIRLEPDAFRRFLQIGITLTRWMWVIRSASKLFFICALLAGIYTTLIFPPSPVRFSIMFVSIMLFALFRKHIVSYLYRKSAGRMLAEREQLTGVPNDTVSTVEDLFRARYVVLPRPYAESVHELERAPIQ